MLKRIICTHGGGRFGNQLLNYIHLTALGLEYPFLEIEQWELNKYLSLIDSKFIINNGQLTKLNKVKKPEGSNVLFTNLVNKIKTLSSRFKITIYHFYFFFKPNASSIIVGDDGCNIGFIQGDKYSCLVLDDRFINSSNKTVCLAGWEFRNWDLVSKWKNEISTHLKGVFVNQEQDGKNVLGVHIRGTDFKLYQGGMLYLSDEKWRFVVSKFLKNNNNKVSSHVYLSDEEKEWSKFINNYNNAKVSIGSVGYSGDLFDAFSDLIKCKWIITNGSTFALMAAWIGNASVYSANDIISNDQINSVDVDDWRTHIYLKGNWM